MRQSAGQLQATPRHIAVGFTGLHHQFCCGWHFTAGFINQFVCCLSHSQPDPPFINQALGSTAGSRQPSFYQHLICSFHNPASFKAAIINGGGIGWPRQDGGGRYRGVTPDRPRYAPRVKCDGRHEPINLIVALHHLKTHDSYRLKRNVDRDRCRVIRCLISLAESAVIAMLARRAVAPLRCCCHWRDC